MLGLLQHASLRDGAHRHHQLTFVWHKANEPSLDNKTRATLKDSAFARAPLARPARTDDGASHRHVNSVEWAERDRDAGLA